jgi:hypothetical protein
VHVGFEHCVQAAAFVVVEKYMPPGQVLQTRSFVVEPAVETYEPATHAVQVAHEGACRPVADQVPAAQGTAVTHVAVVRLKV